MFQRIFHIKSLYVIYSGLINTPGKKEKRKAVKFLPFCLDTKNERQLKESPASLHEPRHSILPVKIICQHFTRRQGSY